MRPEAAVVDPVLVDSARTEFAAGRSWHAARVLAPLAAAGGLDPEAVLLLARAEVLNGHWAEVTGLLTGRPWLDEVDSGEGWLLVGRAHEALGQPRAAADAYGRGLGAGAGGPAAGRAPWWIRRARTAWAASDTATALAALDSAAAFPLGRDWQALAFLEDAITAGDVASVERWIVRLHTGPVGTRTRTAYPRVLAIAGDTAAAAVAWRARLPELEGAGAAEAWVTIGDAARIAGQDLAARDAYAEVLALAPYSAEGARAAAWISESGDPAPGLLLSAARALDRAGDGRRALAAYDLWHAAELAEGRTPDATARVERARLVASVPARRDEGIDEWRELSNDADPRVGLRALQLWRDLRRREGRTSDAALIERWIGERFPDSDVAANAALAQADAARDAGRPDAALEAYAGVIDAAPSREAAGFAWMRSGQIHLARGDAARAATTFEDYLRRHPDGRRRDEAAYWSAHARLAAGDSAEALAHVAWLEREEALSYYAVIGAELVGRDYRPVFAPDPDGPVPEWVTTTVRDLDALEAAGLDAAVRATLATALARARAEDGVALLALAEQLNERGRTMEGIGLARDARAAGAAWSRRLARALHPFPYRDLIERAAAVRGLDPVLVAALVRQESAFVAAIRSPAGAMGLMQVMPATGRDLARRLGPDPFDPGQLTNPDVNVHLGTGFLADMLRRYEGDLVLALAAYNAGPTRASRWRSFPEHGDRVRFIERIPFAETRGYVKSVTRNLHLYRILWGSGIATSAAP